MRPLSLKLENIYSHENSYLNLRDKRLSLILGEIDGQPGLSNTAGKSAIFSAMEFCLFGTTRSGGNRLVRDGEKSGKATLVFRGDDKNLYKIERTIRVGKNETVSSEVSFFYLDGNGWSRKQHESSKERNATQLVIQKTVGMDVHIFRHSVRLQAQDTGALPRAKPVDRRALFKKFVDMQRFDDLEKIAKSRSTETKDQIDNETKIVEDLGTRVEDVALLNQAIVLTESEIVKRQISLQSHKDALVGFQKRLSHVADLEKIAAQVEQAGKDCKLAKDAVRQISANSQAVRDVYAKEVADFKARVADEPVLKRRVEALACEIEVANKAGESLPILTQEVVQLRAEVSKIENQSAVIRAGMETMKGHRDRLLELKGDCPTCFASITASHVKEVVDMLRVQHTEAKRKWESAKSVLVTKKADLEQSESRERNLASSAASLSRLSLEFTNANGILDKIAKDRIYLKQRKESVKAQLEDCEARLSASSKHVGDLELRLFALQTQHSSAQSDSQNLASVKTEIEINENTIKSAESSMDLLQRNLGENQTRLRTAQAFLDEIDKRKGSIEKLTLEFNTRKLVEKSLGKTGIQAIILENSLSYFEATARSYLKRFTNGVYDIRFETTVSNKTNDNIREVLDILIDKGNGIWHPYESFSGAETMKIDLALRVGLALLAASFSSVRTECLYIDEIAGSLDSFGRKEFLGYLVELSKDFDLILVVTHFPELQEEFKETITVRKTGYISTIVDAEAPSPEDSYPNKGVEMPEERPFQDEFEIPIVDNEFYVHNSTI